MDAYRSRTALLLGEDAMRTLARARVAVFGIGGVGSYAVEALARTGIGSLDLIDGDVIDATNLNRQLPATCETVGRDKAAVAAERVALIAPDCAVTPHKLFFGPDDHGDLDLSSFDYVIDAIDTVSSKLDLIITAQALGVPIISSMGAGNKLDPTAFRVADLYQTSVCPLAKVMRRECRKRGVERLKVVFSTEEPIRPDTPAEGRPVPGSVAFVPSVAGLILAGEVIKDLIAAGKPTPPQAP